MKLDQVAGFAKILQNFRLRKSVEIPWGDLSFLLDIQELDLLPRSHLKKHLQARGDSGEGRRDELHKRLKDSIRAEVEEIKRIEEERERKHKEIAALEEQGAVYVIGSNTKGQLGLGDRAPRTKFTVIPSTRGLNFSSISTRNDVVYAVTEDCKVYRWGNLQSNQRHSDEYLRPQRFESLDEEDISSIAVGLNHVCALNQLSVYSWGTNQNGCLGNDSFRDHIVQKEPTLVSFSSHNLVKEIQVGEMHNCALDEGGIVHTWGYSANGRIGHGRGQNIFTPRELKLPAQIKLIACGSEHTLAASEAKVFAWGSNDGGRLGLGDTKDRHFPSEIPFFDCLSIKHLSCGTWHNGVIASSPPMNNGGYLYTFGSGYKGQLGLEATTYTSDPKIVPFFLENQIQLKKLFCGSNHNAALSIEDDIYTWGSNIDGCLGREIEEKFVSFTPKPGLVHGFGSIVNRIGRGLPRSIAIGNNYTVVSTRKYQELIAD